MRCFVCTVALLAMLAVAAAYDPIADNKVPSPKFPVKPSNGVARRMLGLQWGGGSQQAGFFGAYYTGPPYWMPGLPEGIKNEAYKDTATERRFSDLADRK